jgi:hypothetical protein
MPQHLGVGRGLAWWLTPIISAIWEVEIRRIMV